MSDKNHKFSVYYYLLIIFKASLLSLFIAINTREYSITNIIQRPNIDPFSNIILMGQFNFINKNISRWSDAWSKHIRNIVIATPEDTPKQELKFGRYMFYEGDNGHFSPYINMGRVIKENKDIRGLLYVHDDLLIAGSILRKVGGSEWITNIEPHKRDNSVKVYKNGTFISNHSQIFSGHKYFRTAWPAWKDCHKNFLNMFDDPRMEPFLSKPKNNDAFLTAIVNQADMLYSFFNSDEQKNAFLDLLDMFAEHRLFLECAVPTAVSMMQERFGIKVHTSLLCTDWHNLRGNARLMIKNCLEKNSDYEVFHPIKINQHRNWARFFDNVIKL